MDPDLLQPMKETQEFIKSALREKGFVTDEQITPTVKEQQKCIKSSDFLLAMCRVLKFLSDLQHQAFAVPETPNLIENAMVKEIEAMEQRIHHMLSVDERMKKVEEVDLRDIPLIVVKCLLANLLELEKAMVRKYNEIKAEEKAKKNRAKKERRKGKVASQQQKASVEPEIQEANDDFDNEVVVIEKEKVEHEFQVEVYHGYDKKDVETEKTCIPKTSSMEYSQGEITKFSTCIFKGNLTIPVPSNTTDQKPIPIMYFKLDKLVYDMSGYWWADFSMQHRSEYLLNVYGVGETMDEKYFIACESFEQTLANWLEDSTNFGHVPLLSTLKGFLKDVIYGATYVHTQSQGLLCAEQSVNNVYIVNGRAKLGLLRKMEHEISKLDFTASFRTMVRKEISKTIAVPQDLNHLLDHLERKSWHMTCVTHPFFFSASQKCMYAVHAYERMKKCPSLSYIQVKIDNALVRLNIDIQNWTAKVKHAALLDVLKFKKFEVQNDEDKLVDEELNVPAEVKDELVVEEIGYKDNPYSFLTFYRNVVVHIKMGVTYEEIIFEMDNIIPNFLLCVYEALTYHGIFVTVGEDFTSEET